MMDRFEMLLNELTSEKKNRATKETDRKPSAVEYNSLGSRLGEQREIVIRYAVGREENAKVYEGTPGTNGAKEDSFAMAYALGKLVGDMTGLDGKEIGDDLIKSMTKSLISGAVSVLFKGLEDIFE